MKRTLILWCLLSALLAAQAPVPAQAPQQRVIRKAETPVTIQTRTPTYQDVYCSGFIREKPIAEDLRVLTGEEAGLKGIFSDRDIVFLNRGAGFVVNPGGEYALYRRVRDLAPQAAFRGQKTMLAGLGTVYADVGRIRVLIVHDQTVTAEVVHACREIQAGDIAVPFNQKPMPTYSLARFDRYAPPSGQNEGVIVTGKEFIVAMGVGDIVYLNMGTANGVAPGQMFRITRSYAMGHAMTYERGVPPPLYGGERYRHRLIPEQQKALPRDVLGELVVLWTEGRSATAIITQTGAAVFAGDHVETK